MKRVIARKGKERRDEEKKTKRWVRCGKKAELIKSEKKNLICLLKNNDDNFSHKVALPCRHNDLVPESRTCNHLPCLMSSAAPTPTPPPRCSEVRGGSVLSLRTTKRAFQMEP